MNQLNKFHLFVAFVTLAALRISIGFHFFDQGHQKIRKGGFDATGFMRSARGPFQSLFHSMVPDKDGKIRLCFDPLKSGPNKISPEKTIDIWSAYKTRVIDSLMKEEERLVKERQKIKVRLEKVNPDNEEYFVLESKYRRFEETILAIRESRQRGDANRILADFSNQLKAFFAINEEEINYYFLGEERLDGFQRDFESSKVDSGSKTARIRERERRMKSTASNVRLLREQVDTIASDRQKTLSTWLAEIDGIWIGYEYELLNMVPLDDHVKSQLRLIKPSESSMMDFVNVAVPYFDMTVGFLLIVGLFTRTAAAAAGMFLVSILMTQPAILGEMAAPTTILYLIEMCAAFAIFATCAGRYAGLDYFIHAGYRRMFPPKDEE